MIVRKAILIAAGSALILAFPVAVQAQADTGQPGVVPPADPTMAAPAASAPAAAAAQTPAPAADTGATAKDYPRCSATVTDGCIQGGGTSKAHRSKSTRHKKG
jgi:hypothetical protein